MLNIIVLFIEEYNRYAKTNTIKRSSFLLNVNIILYRPLPINYTYRARLIPARLLDRAWSVRQWEYSISKVFRVLIFLILGHVTPYYTVPTHIISFPHGTAPSLWPRLIDTCFCYTIIIIFCDSDKVPLNCYSLRLNNVLLLNFWRHSVKTRAFQFKYRKPRLHHNGADSNLPVAGT